MAYRVSYERPIAVSARARRRLMAPCTERYRTEHEALGRARQLLDAEDHHRVSVCDKSGNVLHGVRLQLRLGYADD